MDIAEVAHLRAQYERDGVLLLKDVLSPKLLRLAREAYDWSLANRGPFAFDVMKGAGGRFFTDTNNPKAFGTYQPFLEASPFADIAATLWEQEEIWFFYEQVFVKEGGDTVRTPWHQDTSYATIDGPHLMAFWMSFEPVAKAHALEFIPGTHHGPLYDGSKLDGDDPLAPLYGDGVMPLLPDIEADRAAWNIVSYATEPTDVIAFHPSVLHGGGETVKGASRHTLTFKVFGPGAVYASGPSAARAKDMPADPKTLAAQMAAALKPGDPYRHPAYPRLNARIAQPA
jgi:ectoine hydroxylase-related dioxygenase (phytanoyl-CoA dioxygenase family)